MMYIILNINDKKYVFSEGTQTTKKSSMFSHWYRTVNNIQKIDIRDTQLKSQTLPTKEYKVRGIIFFFISWSIMQY